MKKAFIFIFIFSYFLSYSFAADYEIKGMVIDSETKQPLPYATIAVFLENNKLLTGTVTNNDGFFSIKNIMSGRYKLQVSFIGYTTKSLDFTIDNSNKNIGNIAVEKSSELLSGVEIVDRKPLIEQKIDKLVMNVTGNISTQNSTALNVLKRAPGVLIDLDGNVKLNGNDVEVWIDNRPSNLSGKDLEALLLTTDGNTIEKIEIIANPSSKYDAAGSSGIINIITKKNFKQGLNGSISTSYNAAYDNGYYNGGNGSFLINHRAKKVNTSFNMGARLGDNFQSSIIKSVLPDKNIDEDIFKNTNHFSYNYKLNQDFHIDSKNIIGYVVRNRSRKSNNKTGKDSYSKTFDNNGNLIIYNPSDIIDNNKRSGWMANINYSHYFDKDKNNDLTANIDYRINRQPSFSEHRNYFFDSLQNELSPSKSFQENNVSKLQEISPKVDLTFSTPIGNIEAGSKYSYIFTENNFSRSDLVNDNWIENSISSNKFNYNEQIFAIYTSVSKMFGSKWTLKAGLRGENTVSNGKWISVDTSTVNSYFNLFPTLYFGFTPNKDFRYSISYAKRINRPYYGQLNPFKSYMSAYSIRVGNPELTPQFFNNITANMGYKHFFNFALIATFANNIITQHTYINDSTQRVLTFINDGKMRMIGASFSLSELSIAKWFRVNINLFGSQRSTYLKDTTTSQFFGNANVSANFYLPHNISLELTGWGMTGFNNGYASMAPMASINFAAKKDILKNKATLSFSVDDIFKTSNHKGKVYKSENNYMSYSYDSSSPTITFGFSYRFGQSKNIKQRKIGADDDTRINDDAQGIGL